LAIDKDDDDDSLTTVVVPYERGVILDQFVAVDNEQAVTETRLGDDILTEILLKAALNTINQTEFRNTKIANSL
jgi:hypothetical protein